MNRQELKAWRERMGWDHQRAGRELAQSPVRLKGMESGKLDVPDAYGVLTELLEIRAHGPISKEEAVSPSGLKGCPFCGGELILQGAGNLQIVRHPLTDECPLSGKSFTNSIAEMNQRG